MAVLVWVYWKLFKYFTIYYSRIAVVCK